MRRILIAVPLIAALITGNIAAAQESSTAAERSDVPRASLARYSASLILLLVGAIVVSTVIDGSEQDSGQPISP